MIVLRRDEDQHWQHGGRVSWRPLKASKGRGIHRDELLSRDSGSLSRNRLFDRNNLLFLVVSDM